MQMAGKSSDGRQGLKSNAVITGEWLRVVGTLEEDLVWDAVRERLALVLVQCLAIKVDTLHAVWRRPNHMTSSLKYSSINLPTSTAKGEGFSECLYMAKDSAQNSCIFFSAYLETNTDQY